MLRFHRLFPSIRRRVGVWTVVLACLCAAGFAVVSLAARPAWAELVRAVWNAEEDGEQLNREALRNKGFAEAVVQEGVRMLPGTLSETRKMLLREYVLPSAGEFVLSYSEITPPEPLGDSNATAAVYEVRVNKQGVKDMLRRTGIFYTLAEPVHYDLQLSGATPESWEVLGRVQTLCGLQADAAAPLRLSLNLNAEMWSGELVTEDGTYFDVGQNLEDVWFHLWANYFSRPGMDDGILEKAVLTVDGWYTADAVEAFDRMLGGWDAALEEAVFQDMAMRATGFTARWKVAVLDRDALLRRLDAYLPPRRLSYALSREAGPGPVQAPAQAPAPAETHTSEGVTESTITDGAAQ